MIIMDDKYRFEDFGFIVEPGNEDPITPVFTNNTMHIPGRAGLWDFGSEIKEKPFSFPLKIMDVFYDEMQRKYNDFVAFLLDAYGKPREIKIIRDYEPDKYYTVKLASQMVPELSLREGTVTVPFVANDPHKYLNFMNYKFHWDSETITMDDSYSINSTFVEDKLIAHSQMVETSINGIALVPDIILQGSSGPVTLSCNGKSIRIDAFTNSTVEILGNDYLIKRNGQEDLINGDFFTLLSGTNRVEVRGSNMNFKMSIKVRDKFS